MTRSTNPPLAFVCAVSVSVLVAGCSLFSNQPGPTLHPTGGLSTASTIISTETAEPSPTPWLVKTITLVALIGEPKDWTPAGLTWNGIQAAAIQIGAATSLVQPLSNAELTADVDTAAGADGTVVVTVGPSADAAVQAAAAAHQTTQFLEVDVVPPAGSPANVHGLAFDEAEAGYLGGYVAAAFAGRGKVGMVADTQTDTSSANYAAGFRSGASEAVPGVTVSVAYAGTPDAPDKGRTAAASLVKAGDSVIMAMPSLSGIGAMREACTRKAQLVAVGTDAWQTVPDVRPCLIVSVMKRYDVAVTTAIFGVAAGRTLPLVTLNDVANGGIALSDFHAGLPAGFQASLDAVLGTLKSGPPRPTPAPPTAEPSARASGSPEPS
jgi:basic membrane protein A